MRKKLTAAVLALVMTLSMLPAALAAGVQAMPTNDKLTVDGALQNPTVYKINGSNYFKIRDLAAILNGTSKQFGVGYDNATKSVTATTGQGYAKQNGDLAGPPAGGNKTAARSNDAIYVNGVRTEAEVYKIDGSNYFKLRDLGDALGFAVDWNAEQGVLIDTTKAVTPPQTAPVDFTLDSLQGTWYAELKDMWGMELSIQGSQLTETQSMYDTDTPEYWCITGTVVKMTEDTETDEIGEITYLRFELKDVTETTIENGKANVEKSSEYFLYCAKEDGEFKTDLRVPFTRVSTAKLYPQYQNALAAAQSKPSYTMTTAQAYNKLLPLYNKELDATETIVLAIGRVGYSTYDKNKAVIEMVKLRNEVLTARAYLEEERIGMLAICDQAPGLEEVKSILLEIKQCLNTLQGITENYTVDYELSDKLFEQSGAIIDHWTEFNTAMKKIYNQYS